MRECLKYGSIIPGRHFRDELAAEGLVFSDALVILKSGWIYNEPEQDIKTGDWKYRIVGSPGDALLLRRFEIVFCFRAVDQAFLITAFSIR